MAETHLSVRSARARDLAHRLALRENRPIDDIVELALEAYEARQATQEPAADFYRRISAQADLDFDLEESIRTDRKVHEGMDL